MGEFPFWPHKESGEIAFPTIALECGVRLPLALFVRRVLNEFLLHPLQVALALLEQCLAICVLWHRLHGRDPSHEKLQSCFMVRQ